MATVYIVDDDAGLRAALARLFKSAGFKSETFASAQELLNHSLPLAAGCIILDVQMPGLSGLDLQGELNARNIITPIIFLTGRGDIPKSVRAIKAGAVDFLTKPVDDDLLLKTVEAALERDQQLRAEAAEKDRIRHRLETLTPREYEVFALVIKGMLNKQIAGELGATEKTIKVHRGRVMEKMEVDSVAELVQAAITVGVHAAEPAASAAAGQKPGQH
jgi:FixJ family two-component response regulator